MRPLRGLGTTVNHVHEPPALCGAAKCEGKVVKIVKVVKEWDADGCTFVVEVGVFFVCQRVERVLSRFWQDMWRTFMPRNLEMARSVAAMHSGRHRRDDVSASENMAIAKLCAASVRSCASASVTMR